VLATADIAAINTDARCNGGAAQSNAATAAAAAGGGGFERK